MTQSAIPFNRPVIIGNEYAYMAQAVSNGHISGDGEFTRKCNRLLEEEVGAAKALLTTSCTHALEMAALLLDIQPGDEVIVPSFTFVSTANAFVLRGATPIFCDIRPDTLNLDESLLPALITDRTKGDRARSLRRSGVRNGRDHGDCRRARRRRCRGQRAWPFWKIQRPPAWVVRLHGGSELPRDKKLELRRRRRVADQRSGAMRTARRFSGKKGPIEASSFAARWTNIRGSMWGRAICRRTPSPPSFWRNWKPETAFRSGDA